MRSWTSLHVLAGTFAASLLVLAAAGPVLADREPTAEERPRIESTLRQLGYQSWEEIEFDDGRWEVDDARHADGKTYDLDLDPETLAVVDKDPDD